MTGESAVSLQAPSVTIGAALARCRDELVKAGVESAALDARLLVAAALDAPVEQVIAWPERDLMPAAQNRLAELLTRRTTREPMAQILGRREFWSLDFAVTRDVLIPRPDSETLVAAVLAQLGNRDAAVRILDLGAGSGCLLLALLSELPRATGLGIDGSADALAVAGRNAAALGLAARASFARGNWLAGIAGLFDVVISNPPYIARAELAALPPEIRHEPRAALDGGDDGLAAYRAIAAGLPAVLAEDGFAALEIGAGQADFVTGILRHAGLEPWLRCPDLSGTTRCLLARRMR